MTAPCAHPTRVENSGPALLPGGPDAESREQDHECCECPSTNIYVLDAESRAILEMDDQSEVYAVTLDESDQGFVYVGTLTRAEYDEAVS